MIQFGEKVQHATCFQAGQPASVPSWELRLSWEEFLWHSPPLINHRLNRAPLGSFYFCISHYMIGQTAFMFLGSWIKSSWGLLVGNFCFCFFSHSKWAVDAIKTKNRVYHSLWLALLADEVSSSGKFGICFHPALCINKEVDPSSPLPGEVVAESWTCSWHDAV